MTDKQTTDFATLRHAAKWLRGISDKCCECMDGHHDQSSAYGTESDVHISRDTARALADWIDTAGADVWAHGPLCACGTGCDACDDNLWEPHARAALAVARGLTTGTPAATEEADRG